MIKNVSKQSFLMEYNNNPTMGNSLAISIVNTNDSDEELVSLSSVWDKSAQLVFDDINQETMGFQLFTKDNALTILNAVLDDGLSVSSRYEHIIIHCTAGVSRSAAIALFLNQLYAGVKITELARNGWLCFNSKVFWVLLEAYDELCVTKRLPTYMERLQ